MKKFLGKQPGINMLGSAMMNVNGQDRQSTMTALLALTGRKIKEQELALEFSETGKGSLLDEAAEVRRSEFEREALQVLHEHGPLTPGAYAHLTGRKRDNVKNQLSRMVSKKLLTLQDGRYVSLCPA